MDRQRISSALRTQLRRWHWISSAVCLAALVLFSVTGFTLNHAADIEARPVTSSREIVLSPQLVAGLAALEDGQAMPSDLRRQLRSEIGVFARFETFERDAEELFFDLAGPGVNASLLVDLASGEATYERTDRGLIAVANDLHKGRHTGPAWSVFIDVVAAACLVFALTGLGLLWIHARRRPVTWPVTLLGCAAPAIVFLLFVHA